jgi:hypothetical protein
MSVCPLLADIDLVFYCKVWQAFVGSGDIIASTTGGSGDIIASTTLKLAFYCKATLQKNASNK